MLSADDEFLNLVSSLVDLEDFGIPHQFLDRVVLVVAISAEHLDRVAGVSVSGNSAIKFADRRIVGVPAPFVIVGTGSPNCQLS